MTYEPNLANWLLEQIAEDERIALNGSPIDAVADHVWKTMEVKERIPGAGLTPGTVRLVVTRTRESMVARCGQDVEQRLSTHIARWDPDRVLAECDAKRRIVAEHTEDAGYCRRCEWDSDERDDPALGDGTRWVKYPCLTLRSVALPFVGHPGYREEWRPDTPG